jgi:two-component system phosphate regulon response regulator PhoB
MTTRTSCTGIEIHERLRRAEETADIPILLLTATVNEREVPPGIETEGRNYMRKPFSPRELQARVAALLRDR